MCPSSRWLDPFLGVRSHDSVHANCAAASVIEPEEDDLELVKESHCIDANLCDVNSSNCS